MTLPPGTLDYKDVTAHSSQARGASAPRPRLLTRALLALAGTVAAVPLAAAADSAPSLAGSPPWFANQVGGAQQVVAVAGDQTGHANVEVWGKYNGQWWSMTGPLSGHIGSAGVADVASEDVPATPTGVFSLPWAFGTEPAPATALPYHRTGPNDWWVADVNSPLYNQFQTCAPGSCPFNESKSERLDVPAYALAVVIGVNPQHVPGAGSAYFLHLDGDGPTAGCVAISEADLRSLITWLRPGAVMAVQGS
ncbi:ErfK/YbiS/YcfS/YnhG family protein [Segniliparus rotundus DSM 44985]|uniref:ErfK/YbiS/YcfS/YnhG family protein n=1 Tax=Segniliparus rotundus (strain ATCC BAA-972 / CDC 1076 / CIP 108378 / DSM 44985 / JCM 13578) TaxID=640132 RepID=D6ZBR6_SEGRD|nr:ErfK/YbiS/YcfS/YnhG family protein [Segniliparus rotundus DSM 44985]